MPIRLEPAIEKEFILENSDKELGNTGEPTTVKIIQAREGGHIERQELYKKFERSYEVDGAIRFAYEYSSAVMRRKEVFLTMTACNLEGPNGKPLFNFPLKDETAFAKAWATLPPIIADEIHEKVYEMNLDWATSGEAG